MEQILINGMDFQTADGKRGVEKKSLTITFCPKHVTGAGQNGECPVRYRLETVDANACNVFFKTDGREEAVSIRINE